MVTIDGYGRCRTLSEEEIHELEQYFCSRSFNGVDKLTNEAYREVYAALVVLDSLLYPKQCK